MSEAIAITEDPNPAKLELSPSQQPVRLDLGGGQTLREGFDCVDLNAPNPVHRVDLFKFPWPFADSSVDEINCSHFIEHIPNRDVTTADLAEKDANGNYHGLDHYNTFVGQNMFFAFFDECWRILKNDAWMTIVWPALQSVRAFQDPTHTRYIPLESMSYLSKEWRELNKLDHYRVRCNFGCNFMSDIGFTCSPEIGKFHPEAQQRYTRNFWNVLIDHTAKIKAIK
jgi:predicted SAM-dependent methyltransferase